MYYAEGRGIGLVLCVVCVWDGFGEAEVLHGEVGFNLDES